MKHHLKIHLNFHSLKHIHFNKR